MSRNGSKQSAKVHHLHPKSPTLDAYIKRVDAVEKNFRRFVVEIKVEGKPARETTGRKLPSSRSAPITSSDAITRNLLRKKTRSSRLSRNWMRLHTSFPTPSPPGASKSCWMNSA